MPVLVTQGGRNIVCTDNREGGILSVLITGGRNIACNGHTGREEYFPY